MGRKGLVTSPPLNLHGGGRRSFGYVGGGGRHKGGLDRQQRDKVESNQQL